MYPKIIALVGGPGTGKTSLINQLMKQGYCCYSEISRQITLEAQAAGVDQLFLKDPLLFSKKVLEGRVHQFEKAQAEPHDLVFLDRGIPDVLAYMHYSGTSYPDYFDWACAEKKYSQILVLPPWKDIYQTDNERYESYEQLLSIHNHLINTYSKYGYTCIEVPKDTVSNRVAFILATVGKEI